MMTGNELREIRKQQFKLDQTKFGKLIHKCPRTVRKYEALKEKEIPFVVAEAVKNLSEKHHKEVST